MVKRENRSSAKPAAVQSSTNTLTMAAAVSTTPETPEMDSTYTKKRRRRRPKRILVLGAGVSGLACARELKQRGYDVLIVEARSRVGGRLKGEPLELGAEYPVTGAAVATASSKSSTKSASSQSTSTTTIHPVDLGGALIHGIDNNPMHQITSQMGVPVHPVSEYCLLLDENGWPVDPKLDEKTAAFFNECLDRTFARAQQDRTSTQSFGSLYDTVCREKLGITDDTDKSWENPLLLWHRRNLELSIGNAFENLSYTWNEDEPYGFDGVHAAVETSWKLVMEQLAEGLDILFGSPVMQIRVVLPDGTTPREMPEGSGGVGGSNEKDESPTGDNSNKEEKTNETRLELMRAEEGLQLNSEPSVLATGTFNVRPRTRSKKKMAAKSPFNPVLRFSRRIRGHDVNVRRSSRSTKGLIQKLRIGHGHVACYDDPRTKSQRIKRPKRIVDQTNNSNTSSDSITDEEIESSSFIHVKLHDGSVLEGDAIVCTLPLGVLKIPEDQPGHVKFVPPLPNSKQEAIQLLGCGLLNKCALSFPKVFWQDSDFLGIADKEYSYLILNTVSYTQKPILIFMYGGTFAREVEEWTDADVVEDCMKVLRRSCGKDIPDPVDYCVTRWGKEKFSKMSFTYIPPGVDGPKELKIMSEAIYDPFQPRRPLVMFAGEHTTPYHPSTMHGAFLSGIREAYRYDLFMEPTLNDNMEFQSSEHIYQHTFHMKRVYRNVKSPKPKSKNCNTPSLKPDMFDESTGIIPAAKEKRSRRRGFGGMTLRSRPKTIVELTPTSVSRKTTVKELAKRTPESGTRRSQRSLAPINKAIAAYAAPLTSIADTCLLPLDSAKEKEKIDKLEDRTLVRALDSYGSDCSFVRSKLLPIYGSTRKRSTLQIQNRWQQLVPKISNIPDALASSWKADSAVADGLQEEIEVREMKTDSPSSSKRTSRRSVRPRLLLQSGDEI